MLEKNAVQAEGRPLWKTIVVIVGVILLVAACLAIRGLLLRSDAASRDFISYWSSAKLLAAHHNPYDRAAIFRLEMSQQAHFAKPLVMRNPPWALFLVMPLGWVSLSTAALLWMVLIIVCALGAIQLMRRPGAGEVPLTLLLFAPTVICAGAEQTSIFTLLGVVLFLRWQKSRPFAAGLALLPAMLKPHLLVLFWVVLVLEMWRRREWRLVAGGVFGMLVANAVALVFDPRVWQDYLKAMKAEQLGAVYCPNVSDSLRLLIAPNAVWMEALPTVAGIAVAVWYWRRWRGRWDWWRQGAMLIALSVLTAPYAWPFDQVLFLPAMMSTLAAVPKRAFYLLGAANLAALAIYIRHPFLETPVYVWMAPVWMAWCIYAYTRRVPQVPDAVRREMRKQIA
ncbi:MAG: glycosyltransferase family 87 protein [Acidobacteriaceae bacterium]